MITRRETAIKNIKNGNPKIGLWSKELLADEDLVMQAFQNGAFLKDILWIPKDNVLSESVLLKAFDITHELAELPVRFWTYERCLAAVKANGEYLSSIMWQRNLKMLPEDFITDEMYRAAIASGHYLPDTLPDEYLNEELALEYIRSEDGRLMRIPEKYMSVKVCSEALKKAAALGNSTFMYECSFIPKEVLLEVFEKASMEDADPEATEQSKVYTYTTKDYSGTEDPDDGLQATGTEKDMLDRMHSDVLEYLKYKWDVTCDDYGDLVNAFREMEKSMESGKALYSALAIELKETLFCGDDFNDDFFVVDSAASLPCSEMPDIPYLWNVELVGQDCEPEFDF